MMLVRLGPAFGRTFERETTMRESRWPLLALILCLLVLLGIALLYAYRAQSPAAQQIPVTAAVAEVQGGQVRSVVIEGNRATITLGDGSRQETTMSDRDDSVARAVADFNSQQRRTPPIELRYEQDSRFLLAAPILVSLLPLLLLLVLILALASLLNRGRAGRRYEDLARIADLRDRAVLTEEEFQREKRRLLR